MFNCATFCAMPQCQTTAGCVCATTITTASNPRTCNHKWHGLGDVIECERCWIQLRVTSLLAEKSEDANG